MNPHHRLQGRNIRMIFPVILRLTVSLILWTLGAAAMRIVAAESQEHRVVNTFDGARAKIEDLQRAG
jgi:hypothetical protein